jgi:hypothetical protein
LVWRLEVVKGSDRSWLDPYLRIPEEEFKIWQGECIRQLEGRLRWLQARERRYRGDVDGLAIELQLGRILSLVSPKAHYPRNATIFDHSFTKEQLGLIYRMLDVIEESIPWEGRGRYRTINTLKAWDLIHKHRKQKLSSDVASD